MSREHANQNQKMSENVGYTHNDRYTCLEGLQQIQQVTRIDPINLDYCGMEACTPGYAFGPNIRTSYVIHMIASGKGRLLRNDRSWSIGNGDAFLIRPKEECTYQADEHDPWRYLWIGFHGPRADEMVRRAGFAEDSPVMHELEVEAGDARICRRFGLRRVTHHGRELRINGKILYLRGRHDGMVFPNTGYAPMDVNSWRRHLQCARDYGLNHVRFHTCCPPEAAFTAADLIGMYLQPELPFWGTVHAPDDPDFNGPEQEYLIEEGRRTIDPHLICYNNHRRLTRHSY